MDFEFHYLVTKGLLLRAEFPEETAETLAHACQLTDDNTKQYCICKGSPEEFSNYISFTYNILKPRKTLLHIYSLFHFIPGDHKNAELRADKKISPFNTTADSRNAGRILELAFESGDLYRIGIALHAFADTWAHQNFTGLFDDFNAMSGFPQIITPNVGHADAGIKTEHISFCWEDKRLVQPAVDNNKRFLQACKRIFEESCLFRGKTSQWISREWKKLREDLLECFGRPDPLRTLKMERFEKYKSILGVHDAYENDLWLNEAVEQNTEKNHIFKLGHPESHWFRFQKAIIQHQKSAYEVLENLFNKTDQKNEWVAEA